MANKQLRKNFKEAADIARNVPEEFREVAFSRALDQLLKKPDQRASLSEEKAAGISEESSEDDFFSMGMGVLNFAADHLGLESLTGIKLARTLKNQMTVEGACERVIKVLGNADSLMHVVAQGSETAFNLFFPEEEEPEEKRPKKKRSKKKKKKKSKAGATSLVRDLIAIGFFSSTRTVADVILYLQRKGVSVSSRELSSILSRLLKAGLLSRRKNKSGRYEYKSA